MSSGPGTEERPEGEEPEAAQAGADGGAEPSATSDPSTSTERAVHTVPDDPTALPPPEERTFPNRAEAEAPAASLEVSFHYFGSTDVGRVREHNEDNFLVADLEQRTRGLPDGTLGTAKLGPRGLVLAVCDGMGGAAAGEVASQMAVDTIHEVLHSAEPSTDRDDFARRLVRAIEEAGTRIFSAAKLDRTRRGMGTTSTVAGLIDKVLFVGQVGDSRAYVLRGEKLALVTKDQSLVNQLIEAGQLTEEEAEAFEHNNIILQALGTTEDVTVDLTFLELRKGDRLMLCSDGLSGLVHAEAIREIMRTEPDLTKVCSTLIEMANTAGGHDNITCVVAEFDGDGLGSAEGAPPPGYQQYPLPMAEDEGPSGPVREPSMKAAGAKPGADVKRDEDPTVLPVRPFPWWMIAAVLVLCGVAAAIALATSDVEDGPIVPSRAVPLPSAPSSPAAPVEPTELVEVRVQSDVPGATLYVDGVPKGFFQAGVAELELAPGAYRVEARTGDEVAVAATVTVRDGVPADVSLMLPSGSTEEPPEAEGPEAEESADDEP